MNKAFEDRAAVRRAIAVVSGFLSPAQLRELADSVQEIERANAELGTRSQADANVRRSLLVDRIVNGLSLFYCQEMAAKLRR